MKQRIRVSAKAYQQQLTPAAAHPAFTVRQHQQKATRRLRNRSALAITMVLHVIGLFWLVYTIQPTEIIEDVIHVDLIEPIREKRATIKQKPREIKRIATTQPIQSDFMQADTTVKVQPTQHALKHQKPAMLNSKQMIHYQATP